MITRPGDPDPEVLFDGQLQPGFQAAFFDFTFQADDVIVADNGHQHNEHTVIDFVVDGYNESGVWGRGAPDLEVYFQTNGGDHQQMNADGDGNWSFAATLGPCTGVWLSQHDEQADRTVAGFSVPCPTFSVVISNAPN